MTTHPEAAMTREQVQWFCQPTKSGSPTPRKWLLRFDDAEVGDCYFDNEAEAYAAFDRANIGYSCWLFATMPTRTGEAPWVSSALASTRQEPAPSADAEEMAKFAFKIACDWGNSQCSPLVADAIRKDRALRRYAGDGRVTWRPIETAPKEPHSKYLGWCEFGDPRSPDGEARIITLDYNGFPYAFGCKQTVRWWMPLPESPAARVKSSEKGGTR